ncbi:serine hydrolase [Aquimarina sp. U1-2]|uniref:serine hydrolase domain-containing protein n=1 Tax=Aquimarina sp. U1-2 TaxID=2823141 RepID=UPI001AED0582|nr:serine hydrolase [Aquimarina sp. U1-2]MBP2831139.1 serine hydrolase [Aquimarina sp. U1-2]
MKLSKKIIALVFLILLGVICVVALMNYPKLTVLTGYSAKHMSSSVFLGDRTVAFTDSVDNNFAPVHFADDKVDLKNKVATASVFGLKERKAIYRDGVGSVLINEDFDENKPVAKPKRFYTETELPYPYGNLPQKDTVSDAIGYDKIDTAVNSIFDTPGENLQKTRAVLVLYKGHIIAERYSQGLDKNSRLLGWSMTKSILATIFGVLEKEEVLTTKDRAPVAAWKNDDREDITLHNLLQMNCGLEWNEDYTSLSDVTRMLYLDTDMTTSQIYKKARHTPNQYWYYSSGVSNLLSGILRTYFDTYQEYLDYPYREFIDKIGMHSMLIETDLAGNYVGSSYAWATVRDWGKFGFLYLNKGNWNGEQIFKPEWVDYVTTPSPTSEGDYGAHFWLNAGGFYPDAPRDMFSANGFQGQRVFIIPSKDLVVVRFGLKGEEGVDFNAFLKNIVAAIK